MDQHTNDFLFHIRAIRDLITSHLLNFLDTTPGIYELSHWGDWSGADYGN